MNKNFWDNMVKIWCKVATVSDLESVARIANEHASKDRMIKSGYSLNPLDDEEDDFD